MAHSEVEGEARLIRTDTADEEHAPVEGLGTAIHAVFKPFSDIELELPPRELMRDPPRFE